MEENTKYRTVYDIYECAAKIIKHFGTDNQADDIKFLLVILDVKEKLEDLLKKIVPQKTVSQLLNIYCKSLVKKKIFSNDTDIAVLHVKNWNKARRMALSIFKYAADNNINLPSVSVGSGSPYDFEKLQNWAVESIVKISQIVKICIYNIKQIEPAEALKTVEADLLKHANGASSQENLTDTEQGSNSNQRKIKEPSREANEAYNLYYTLSRTQNDIADIMSKQYNRKFTQSQISRYIRQVKEWRKENNLLFETVTVKPQIIPTDPAIIESGKRTDGKITGDPRNKAKSEQDDNE
ncbi:MAG: hypothetical protein A2Y10_15370 [Planctomycetes bacterium GWF2_41_51]|nr:MAG: hypothetical protein A2Y10_15370 [Planctomycetes bacterium GWF2_41_51]HBG26981.1 hypothetical protein [Phycisphaerales bacterium]